MKYPDSKSSKDKKQNAVDLYRAPREAELRLRYQSRGVCDCGY